MIHFSLLDPLSPLNIEARYPLHKSKLLASLTVERCEAMIKETRRCIDGSGKGAEYRKKYASAVRETVNASAIFLYGSCEKGTATADSDIDIAVVVDDIPGDYLSTVAMLWKLTRSVDHTIEPVLLTAADDAGGFLRTVQQTGIAV